MATIFTKIINGEIPCYKVAESENYFAFLDINPLHKGHTLVIPKLEVDYIFDLPNDIYTGLFAFSKKVAAAIEATIKCNRIGVAVIGLEVPHAHIHLVPINNVHDLNFKKPRVEINEKEFAEIAASISSKIES